jgi:peptide chain release factor subunit 1
MTMGSREIPRELSHLSDIDMRGLAETSDDRDVFLSVYIPTASREEEEMNASYVRARVGAIRDAIAGDLETDFERTFAVVEELLFHDGVPGEKGRVVFASAPKGYLEVHRLGVKPPRSLVLDNSPFILPLARLMDDHEDYGIILMDSREAHLYLVQSSVMEEVESTSIDLMNRHKKGGMSQKRFNRLRRGQIEDFIDEIVDDLDRLEDMGTMRGLVVAGPGETKEHLVDALPKRYAAMVIGVVDVDMDLPRDHLMAHGDRLARADEASDEDAAVEELRKAIYKDELAAVGVQEVRDAMVQGRVAMLLVDDDVSIPGWICESCKMITEARGACPSCGGTISNAELINEMAEMAERTGAEVQHVRDSSFLESIGGLGAVLRY